MSQCKAYLLDLQILVQSPKNHLTSYNELFTCHLDCENKTRTQVLFNEIKDKLYVNSVVCTVNL